MLITRKHIWIALVAVIAVVGSTVSLLSLSAQDPATATPMPLSSAIATVNAELADDVTYCDYRSDGITVQGSGVVTLPANIGVVELGVDVTAETVVEARSTAASSMQLVIDAVKEQGVTDDQITTTRLIIRPETTWVEEDVQVGEGLTGRRSRQVITGYRVSNRVRIEIDVDEASEEGTDEDTSGNVSETTEGEDEDADILSAVIDAAATAGGDNVRIDSISFRADQTVETVDEARNLAVQDALHRAGLYADAFGVEVGVLLSASEVVASTPVFDNLQFARAESAAFDGASTPISAGDVEVRASITAKFAIAQPGCVDKKDPAFDKDADGDTE